MISKWSESLWMKKKENAEYFSTVSACVSSSVSGKIRQQLWVSFQPHLFLFPHSDSFCYDRWRRLFLAHIEKKQWSAALLTPWQDKETLNYRHHRMLLNVHLIFRPPSEASLIILASPLCNSTVFLWWWRDKWNLHQSHWGADTIWTQQPCNMCGGLDQMTVCSRF